MNYQTILVPGVAWPEYIPPASLIVAKAKKKYPKRIDDSVTSKVQEYVLKNPGLDALEIVAALEKFHDAKTITNSLAKLRATNRLDCDLAKRRGHWVRLYRAGPRAQ